MLKHVEDRFRQRERHKGVASELVTQEEIIEKGDDAMPDIHYVCLSEEFG